MFAGDSAVAVQNEDCGENPPRRRVPAPGRGRWSGTPGDSEWTPNDRAHWGLRPGETVTFRDGTPDFTRYAHARPNGQSGAFEVPGLTGNHGSDYDIVVRHRAGETGWTQEALRPSSSQLGFGTSRSAAWGLPWPGRASWYGSLRGRFFGGGSDRASRVSDQPALRLDRLIA